MLALATAALLLLYVILPATFFRFALSLLFRTKRRPRSRAEEVTLAIVVSVMPLQLARCIAFGHSLVSIFSSTTASRADYRTLFAEIFGNATLSQAFWDALERTAWQQWTFLRWFYCLVIAEAVILGVVIHFAGARIFSRRAPQQDNWLWRLVAFGLSRILLPNISEWDVFFNTKLNKGTPHVDVVTSEDLHTGAVADFFLDDDGQLSGLCLGSPHRFRRERYREESKGGEKKNPDDYWKPIPGELLYVAAENIVSINVRYVEEPVVNQVPFTAEVRGDEKPVETPKS